MTVSCSQLVPFVDGELDEAQDEAFRLHLKDCDACRSGLVEEMQLSVRLESLGPPTEQAAPAPVSEPEPSSDFEVPPSSSSPPSSKHKPRVSRRWVATALAVAATIVLVPQLLPKPSQPSPVASAPSAFAALTTRPFDIRIAHPDAAAYRPRREEMRGAAGPAVAEVPYEALGRLQKSKDDYSLAIARAWNGDDPKTIADQLRKIDPRTPSIRSDLAAIEALTRTGDNVESVLTELEQLERSPDTAVARAARWNHAVLLSKLDLPLGAAKAFRDIARDGEAGWADEASKRATAEERRGNGPKEQWERARQAGEALVKTGELVAPDLIQRFPGILREYFYDAVRAAPDRERVLALAPMAAALDRIARDGDRAADQRGTASVDRRDAAGTHRTGTTGILTDHVRRIAKLDFRRRGPLATAYAQFLEKGSLSPELEAAITANNPAGDVIDIVVGVADQQGTLADHRDALGRLAARGDPWFEIMLAEAEASLDERNSNWLGAQARLESASARCPGSLTYRCLFLGRKLGRLYATLELIPESLRVLRATAATARSTGEWDRYLTLLWQLADAERLHSATAMARAYAGEYLLAKPDCRDQQWAYRTFTGAAILDVDGRAARRHLAEVLRCSPADLRAANYLTDIARLDPQPDDLPRLQAMLQKLRSGAVSPTDAMLMDGIEGRLLIERDRAAGRALLDKVIAAADKLPRDITTDKARAGAYTILAFDAGRAGDHARVLSLIARNLGLPPPGPCTVAMVAEDQRAVVAVRGIDGQDQGTYDDKRAASAAPPTVSPALAQSLSKCGHVRVMAPAALQNQPRALPAELPWSYATTDARARAGQSTPSADARTLIVTNVTPPEHLRLPRLEDQLPESGPSITILSGADATPTRVFAAMGNATEIQFHTHALVDLGVSDVSHLVLSAEPDGRYALTAESIRNAQLRGHPIVVLAACRTAEGVRFQHAPWSLPHAFLAVGARAVFAIAREIPDRQAQLFFDRVLVRVRAGVDPASALRDERRTAIERDPSNWAADVILFE